MFPHLEGTHPSARFMRFADIAEVEARATELSAIAAAWCALVAQAAVKPKPTPNRTTRKART